MSHTIVCTSRAQAVLRVSNGANFFVNNNGRVVLNNTDFENNGNMGIASFSRFVFTGNSALTTISGSGNIVLGELELNKSAGVLQLNRPLSIFTSIIFSGGNLDINGNTLFLVADPDGQLIGENNNSRIIGNSGLIRKTALLNAPSNINPGNIGVVITSSLNPGFTNIDRQHYSISGQNLRRVFHLTPTVNSGLNATLQFHYLDAELGGLDENLLTVWRSSNGTSGWTNLGGALNTSANTITLSGINDFAWYTIAPSTAALPAFLSEFTVACNNDEVNLKWKTTQEQNTDFMEIQSSLGGNNWTAIGKVKAAGNSTVPQSYGYTDISSGRKFYRLRMVDKDGKFSYSPTRLITCDSKNWKITVYPNPVTDKIELVVNGINRNSIPVELVNAAGQLLWQQPVALTNQCRRLSIPVTHLARGVYFLRINEPGYQRIISISKQ